MTPQELKNSILQRAFEGKLVQQLYKEPPINGLVLDEEPFDIPENWCWQLLGNCCEMYTGNSIAAAEKKAKYEDLSEGYDYIATKDVEFDQTISYNNGVRIPFDTTFRIAKKGSVLMCIEGGSAGRKICILDKDVCFGNKLCTFNSTNILNKYIYYYLQSSAFKKSFTYSMTGIIGGVSIKNLKSIPIPIPSIEEQQFIVDKIEELLPYIDKYEIAWTKLERTNQKFPGDLQKSILQMAMHGKLVEQRPEEGNAEELYNKIQAEKQILIKEGKIRKPKLIPEIPEDETPFNIPESWKWVRLGNIVSLLSGSDFSPSKYNNTGQGIPYMTGASNIVENELIINRWTESPNNISELNDLLIVCKGSGYGKTVFNNVGTIHIARQFMAFQHGLSLDYSFLNYFLLARINRIKKSGQGVIPGIDRESILKMEFPLPPLREQSRIVERINSLLELLKK